MRLALKAGEAWFGAGEKTLGHGFRVQNGVKGVRCKVGSQSLDRGVRGNAACLQPRYHYASEASPWDCRLILVQGCAAAHAQPASPR